MHAPRMYNLIEIWFIYVITNFRYFGGIKLGTGGLARAYGGVAAECLKNSTTVLFKSKVVVYFLFLCFSPPIIC